MRLYFIWLYVDWQPQTKPHTLNHYHKCWSDLKAIFQLLEQCSLNQFSYAQMHLLKHILVFNVLAILEMNLLYLC